MKRLIYTFALLFVTLSMMAATITGGTVLYLKPNSNWTKSNAWFAMYLCNGSSAVTWVKMVSVGDGIYAAVVPSGQSHKNVIFVRMNPNNTALDWSAKWNQSGDLTWDGSKNLCTINNGQWDCGTNVSWSKKETTWTLVGSSTELFGGNWTTDSKNQLELQSNGKYTKTYSNKKLSKGGIEYKVYGNNSNSFSFPQQNGRFEIEKDGFYDITFSFDILTQKISVTIKQKPFEIKAGGEYLFLKPNSNWKIDNARFAMYYFRGEDNYWVDMVELKSHSGIYYALLPEGFWDNIIFVRMNSSVSANDWNNKWNQTSDLVYNGTDNLYEVKDGTWDEGGGIWSVLETKESDIIKGLDAGAYYVTMTYTMEFTEGDEEYWHWISLPFDVNISDVKGVNDASLTYERDLVFKCYNTEIRAGWPTKKAEPWEQLEETGKLDAGRGYILGVGESVSEITFKSAKKLHNVIDKVGGNNAKYESTETINSNWHLIGTGVYGNVGEVENINYVAVPKDNGEDGYNYYYLGTELNANDPFNNSLSVSNLALYKAFFVQYGGVYSFTKQQNQLAQNAAPRRAKAEEIVDRYYVNIVGMADTSHTAIFLAEDGSDDYVVGKDFLHLGASGASLQLYTLQGESTLSFNYLKREDRTVLVGGYVAQSGKYTISLDGNGEASSVLLYDMETGLVADLLNENYEFEAEKGILDGRFSVIISYAAGDGPATEVENDMTMKVVVVNCDGIARFEGLSVGENVAVYDVVGRCVTQFVAESDKADVMLTSGVYMLYHNGETVKFVVNR